MPNSRKNKTFIHKTLAAGRWFTFSINEQLGNVGGEISRMINWRGRDPALYQGAADRALELMDLTISDPRWRAMPYRLRELTRARETLVDAILGGKECGSTLENLDRYFYYFALAARTAAHS